ncbi:MAG TPA: S9 family peptidase [Candidatus Koribacter sp.]|jgi:dipeptidyl aminopeptidase/acylaminoacyl peptidase
MRRTSYTIIALFFFLSASLLAQVPSKRPIAIDDMYRMQEVGHPQISSDGKWIAYTVTSVDREADKRVTSVWMVNWDGTQDVQLTHGPQSASSPRWSPDGRYLAFMSSRPPNNKTQVWLLDRRGGEARQLTDVKEDLSDYAWSPDGKQMILQMSAGDDDGRTAKSTSDTKVPKPIVIDRYHFKSDGEGYITAASNERLYLFDVESKKLSPLTTDPQFDDGDAAWSPDGARIAYASNHAKDADRTDTSDIFVMDARSGATPVELASFYRPSGQHLAWSPDGKLIAYMLGVEPKYGAYNLNRLAVIPVAGGPSRVLTDKFDRGVGAAEFTPDGSALTFLVPDDRREYVESVPVSGGPVQRISGPDFVVSQISSAAGHSAVTASSDTVAAEIFSLESGKLHRLTTHNDALLSELQLGAVDDISFKSKDGTEIHGMMIKPPSFDPSRKYPTLLWIHGGPNGQDAHALYFNTYPLEAERQLFAAQGYVVLAINYRGSSGRGEEFSRSIFADWGNKEVADLLAGLDYAIKSGVADPNRLIVGGWSYGGILTDYLIASDSRFKAAISGAGIGNELSMYGSDQYIIQYNNELGPPWKSLDTWIKVSYPFFHADRIHTPTLFMGGTADFNVPIAGGEQMYEALRTLNVPTELVVYPGQHHLFTRPSYINDRLHRFVDWYKRYVQ